MLPYSNREEASNAKTAGLPKHVEEISTLLQSLSQTEYSHNNRLQLLESARKLVLALESPREELLRHCWQESINYSAIHAALDLDLFHKMQASKASGTVSHLSEVTGADDLLLSRLMKHYAAIGVVEEIGPEQYALNAFSKLLSTERYIDGFRIMSSTGIRAALEIPTFLKKNKYCDPRQIKETPFNISLKQSLNLFDYLREEPERQKQFNDHMAIYAQGRIRWFEYFPVKEQLIVGKSIGQNDVLLVDIGGNMGHDLKAFKAKWPNTPGRLVLQDRKEALPPMQDLSPTIHAMEYDFFTEQPVKGARAYYMHSVLHDWSDEACLRILSEVVKAMKQSYSKLLIEENVVPEVGAHWEMTSLDLMMMTLGSGERTHQQWRSLIESAGLRIVKIWNVEVQGQSLIECQAI